MDLRAIIAAAPVLKRVWQWLPKRLRFPLLAVAFVIWLWRRLRGTDEDDAAEPAPDAS